MIRCFALGSEIGIRAWRGQRPWNGLCPPAGSLPSDTAYFWVLMPAFNALNGIGRQSFPAKIALVAGIASMALVGVFAPLEDVTIDRVAWSVVLPIIPVWGIIVPWCCCRETRQPMRPYVWQEFLIPMLSCLPACIVGILWNRFRPAVT